MGLRVFDLEAEKRARSLWRRFERRRREGACSEQDARAPGTPSPKAPKTCLVLLPK